MGCNRGDSFPFDYAPNGIPFGSYDQKEDSPPPLQYEPFSFFVPKSCAMFWNEWKINFPILMLNLNELTEFVRLKRCAILYLTFVVNLGLEDFSELDSETLTSDTR